MAMPQCCYLAKGAKRPSHTTSTIKFDRVPFDPCNSIRRFDLCPFDQKNSTYLQPPLRIITLAVVRQHQDTAAVKTLYQVRPNFVLLVIRASICSIQHVQQLLRETEPLESLLPYSEVFFLARELEILQRSIHPSQTPTKARSRQKEVTEAKMRAAKQGFPRR